MSGLQVETKNQQFQGENKKSNENINSLFPNVHRKDENQNFGYGQANSNYSNSSNFNMNMGGMPVNQNFMGYNGGPTNNMNFIAPGVYQNNIGSN